MPRLWHYLLSIFFKIFGLCFLASLGIGLLLKHEKFTKFIATGASLKQASILALGFLCRPMPLAIALSALVAAFILSYRLSATSEITALRSSGLSITTIFFPIYAVGLTLALFNFFISSELVPYMQLMINDILLEEIQINPLVLLQQNSLPFFKEIYTDMDLSNDGTHATSPLIVFKNEKHDRLTILKADTLDFHKGVTLEGKNFSIISHVSSPSSQDLLFIDNLEKVVTPGTIFHLPIKHRTSIKPVQIYPFQTLLKLRGAEHNMEMMARISKGLLPLSFTILGISFGLFIGRTPKFHYPLFALLAAALFLSLFATKSTPSIIFLPHLFAFYAAWYKQKRLTRGKS